MSTAEFPAVYLLGLVGLCVVLFVFMRWLLERTSKVYLGEGEDTTFTMSATSSIKVEIVKVEPSMVAVNITFFRMGQPTYSEDFKVLTEETGPFILFPTPGFPWRNETLELRGWRVKDKMAIRKQKTLEGALSKFFGLE